MANQDQWQDVHAEPVGHGSGTQRLKIENGWLYRTNITGENGQVAVALCFVSAEHPKGEYRARNPLG